MKTNDDSSQRSLRHQVELGGFLIAEFDAGGKCVIFREWRRRREQKSVEAAQSDAKLKDQVITEQYQGGGT